jgi:hypothetical protein
MESGKKSTTTVIAELELGVHGTKRAKIDWETFPDHSESRSRGA